MAVQSIARRTAEKVAFPPAVVGRGRPSMVTVRETALAEAQMETDALREELRALGRLSPTANRVHAYVARVGESIEAEQMSAAVAAYLARAARRYP